MIVMEGEEFLTAREACEILSVKPSTLYAYVSRGLLRSYRPGIKRMRLYRREEVEQLTRLREPAEKPRAAGDATGEDDGAWIRYV